MGSLARLFCNTPQAFQAIQSPYLQADPARRESIRSGIRAARPEGTSLICGLSWISTNESTGQERTIALQSLIAALKMDKVQFVSLQYGSVDSEVATVKETLQTQVMQVASVDNFYDLDGLAALADACDLVITIDNSTAHLAGALGKPTWLLLPFAANWRWMLDSDETPWYPSVKLYRQTAAGDWNPVFRQLQADLAQLL